MVATNKAGFDPIKVFGEAANEPEPKKVRHKRGAPHAEEPVADDDSTG